MVGAGAQSQLHTSHGEHLISPKHLPNFSQRTQDTCLPLPPESCGVVDLISLVEEARPLGPISRAPQSSYERSFDQATV
jgi:hypothetical protein